MYMRTFLLVLAACLTSVFVADFINHMGCKHFGRASLFTGATLICEIAPKEDK